MARRTKLEENMRAWNDPPFSKFLMHMRQTDNPTPLTREFLEEKIKTLQRQHR